jgi:hypothetical protein
MAMHSEVFGAASDEDAEAAIDRGPNAHGIPGVVETGGLTSMEMDLLHSTLTGRRFEEILRSSGGELIATGGDNGPWVERIRHGLTDLLTGLTDEQVADAGPRWAAHDDLAGADPVDVTALLAALVELARTTRAGGQQLYLWNAM